MVKFKTNKSYIYNSYKYDYNNEIWKDTEYDNYQVSNYGRVRSFPNHIHDDIIILKPHISFGYYRVSIKHKGVKYLPLIHRLVAKAFIPNPNNLRCVNHKDEDKTNNKVDNLEWCTDEYNKTYSSGKAVAKINIKTNMIIDIYPSIRKAARENKADYSAIRKCCEGTYNLPYYRNYYWKYY